MYLNFWLKNFYQNTWGLTRSPAKTPYPWTWLIYFWIACPCFTKQKSPKNCSSIAPLVERLNFVGRGDYSTQHHNQLLISSSVIHTALKELSSCKSSTRWWLQGDTVLMVLLWIYSMYEFVYTPHHTYSVGVEIVCVCVFWNIIKSYISNQLFA